MALGQTAVSSVFPVNPTYVDAVTSIVTIPAVAGQAPVTGMIDYSVDGGPISTAMVSTGDNYLNLGQLSIGSHVLTFQAHSGSPSASPIVPPPVSIPVTDQGFSFVGVYGRFHSNYTDANLVSSAGLAIDSKDTVWIADSILSKLVSFDIFGNINDVAIASLPIPIANPAGLAFDSSDNLFIADRGNSRIVKYTPAGVETILPTPGLGRPGQLMLDKVKNLLYIVDQDNERVVRYDLSAMALAGDPFSGLTAIQSIALDPAGNVYVSDNVARFLKNVNGVVSALPVNAPIAEAGGIYIDRAGLLYLTDSSINGTYRIDAQGHQTQISDFDSSHAVAEDSRGRIYFGTSTNVRVFTPAGELGVAAATKSMFSNTDQNNSLVYTMPQGLTALTQVVSPTPPFYYDVETLSCPYIEIRGTCYFEVNFAPKVPGVHTGSIATTLPGGPTITTLLYGNATGPAPAFSPGTQTQTPTGAADSEGVALDEAGNYYVSDATGNQVYETSGGVTRPLGFAGLSFPEQLAVDGAGAVYVQDLSNRIAKLDRAGNQTFLVAAGAGNALSELDTFAMDGGGQIYFAGVAAGGTSIYLYDRTGATSLIASGLVESAALALDPYGDIYSLQVDGSLLRIDPYGKQSTLVPAGTFHNHTSLAVDASETAYVAQDGVAAITLVHPDGTTESIPVPALSNVGGIAINGTGSILAVDAATNQYIFVDRTHQDFNFGDVPLNTTTTFSASFGNAGTEPFQIITLPGDSDFRQVTTADACSTSGANATVAPASSCNLSYTVAPTAIGAITAYGGVSTNVSQDSDTFTVNAVRVPVAPTFLPALVSFGNVNVGATATQTLTLTNNDTSPLTLASLSVTGSFSITGASTCKQNGTIAVQGSCSFTVQFAPTVTGMASSALVVQYTGGSATATLSGTGVAAPTATLTPASYNFGNVTVGASSGPVNFQLTNTSSVSVTISDVSVMGSGFHLLGKAGTLAPGASTTFEVAFLPTSNGAVTGTLSAVTSAGTLIAALSGTGVTPTATLTPASYDFGNVTVGATSNRLLLKFTNTGTTTLHPGNATGTLRDLQFPATAATTCTGSSGSTVVTLAPGASCNLAVDFAPTTAGTQTGIVSIPSEAGNTSATITGTGVTPTATLTPATYNFGSLTVGSTSPQLVLTLTNTSNVSLHTAGSLSSSPAFVLLATATGCVDTTVLAPGGSCNLTVNFSPTAVGAVTGTISIASEAGTDTVTLTGTGQAPTATLTPAAYNFGNVTVGGTSSQLVLKFTNTSTITLHPGNANATVDLKYLSTAATTCTGSAGSTVVALAPGASCNLAVEFAPTTVGTQTGIVSIPSEAGNTSATLSGTGIAPTATLTPASYNFGDVTVGSTSSQLVLTFTNTSGATLHPGNASGTLPGLQFLATAATTCTGSAGSTVVALAPGASCNLAVEFAPTTAETQTGVVSIPSEAGTTSASITGTGVAPAPPPTVSPATLSFGNVTVGATSAAQTVTITNPATFALTLTSIGLNGSGFSIQPAGTTCKSGPAIAAGASCTLSVIFTPAVAGAVSGSLTIGLPPGFAVSSLTVPLTGTGAPPTTAIDFGTGFSTDALTLSGPATIAGGALQLTSGQSAAASSAFFPNPAVTTTFATDFTFQLLDPATEGITFTIQGDGPAAVGSNGGGLGYQGIPKSIALKFDLRDTAGEGDDSTGIYVGGAAPTVPATSLADSGIDLHSGDVFALHIAYDGTTEFITLTDTVTNASWTTQAAENIPSIVGGNSAYFGFTAGTGAVSPDVVAANSQAKSQTKSLTGASAKPMDASATAASTTAASIIAWKYNVAITPATLAPTALNFGNVTVGSTSSVQTAELIDTGTAQFQVSSITPSDPAIVVHSSYCARPVTPGAYCKLEVTLAPSAGPFSGTVVINYYLGDGTLPGENFTSTLAITGTGVVPSVTLTPASADFGSSLTSSPKTFTLTNSSASAVTLTQVTIAEDPSLPFQISSGATCISGGQLAAGKSCTVPVVFAPTATSGATSGTLYISYLDAYGKAVTLTSLFTGTVPATLTPANFNFGNVTVGTDSPNQPITLTNTGTVPLSVGASSLSGAGFSPVATAFGPCPASLAAGQSCVLTTLQFAPTVAGAVTGSVSVVTGAGTLTAALNGTGVAPPKPTATLTPANFNFGNVTVGTDSPNQPITLTNTGTVPLSVGASSLTGAGFSAVATAFGPCPASLAAGQSCVLTTLQFAPTMAGAVTGSVSVVTGAGTLTAALNGTGVAPPKPTATLTPANFNFGNVTVGTDSPNQPITLTNTGTVPLSVGASSLTGAGFSAVATAFGPCPASLAAGQSCVLTTLQFAPTVAGAVTGSVSVVTGAGTLTATLNGTGVAPPVTTPFINLGTGFTADALTLTGPVNVAGGALELTAGPSSAASSAFYPTPVPTASFTTDFTFQLLDPTAEGITFTIQGDGPNAVGLGGGGLGYQGLAKSIAVKFDLKDTVGEGIDSTGIYVNGAAPTVPAVSLASSGIDLHSGDVFDLRLSYDGTTMTVNLTDTVTNATWSTKATEDIPGITGGSTAYFGFTAGSGTPTLNSGAAEAKPALAVRRAAVAADATPVPATSNILSWIYVANGATKAAQKITFPALRGTAYGCAPITLAATANSGLPVSYAVAGPAKLFGTTLTVTGIGAVTVTATQGGNASFVAAVPVVESFTVARRTLTVTASSLTRVVGIANAALTYKLSGFVDGDTASAIGGTAVVTTAAVATSLAGSYPITFSSKGLTAANYNFNYVAGTLTVVPTSCQTISYSNGFTAAGLSLNNGATVVNNLLQLTDGHIGESRSAFFTTPMPVNNFAADFTVQLLNPVADGMTFVIQSNSPNEFGLAGGGLGYAGIPNSMAFKLDLHDNNGEGPNSTGMYFNGAYPSTPAINLAPAGIDLHSGHIFKVHLAFSGTSTTGTIIDTVTGTSASASFPGDITKIVGSSAYIGFTAGTGGGTAIQNILNWSFSGGTGCGAR
jgi:sugar lactone lactonase YvrE